MTHDELLADIDTKILLSEHTIYPIYMQAFRAVVELCNFLDKKGHCCVPVKEVIQAIEKELG
jgi:hypothetical protein